MIKLQEIENELTLRHQDYSGKIYYSGSEDGDKDLLTFSLFLRKLKVFAGIWSDGVTGIIIRLPDLTSEERIQILKFLNNNGFQLRITEPCITATKGKFMIQFCKEAKR